MLSITWASERLELLPQRAVFWPRKRTLFIADPHFGKAASFRHAGVPVPSGSTRRDTHRLTELLDRTRARRLVILGDFFHASTGRAPPTMTVLDHWRQRHADLRITLIRGNHDLKAGDPPDGWRFDCADEPLLDPPFVFCHDPAAAPANSFTLAGHVHPSVTLHDVDATRLTCPCFSLGPRLALLPAFGSFTGTHRLTPTAQDRIFITGHGEVIEVSG